MVTPCLCLEIDRMASGWHQNTSTYIRFNARGFLKCKQGDLQQFVKGESKGCSNPEENRIRKMTPSLKKVAITKVHSSESANSSALSFIMWYCALFCQYSIYGTDPIFFWRESTTSSAPDSGTHPLLICRCFWHSSSWSASIPFCSCSTPSSA